MWAGGEESLHGWVVDDGVEVELGDDAVPLGHVVPVGQVGALGLGDGDPDSGGGVVGGEDGGGDAVGGGGGGGLGGHDQAEAPTMTMV